MSTITRTPDIDVDASFEYHGEVCKSWVDRQTGERWVRGTASGVQIDRDGERVSKRAIASMVRQIIAGGVKLTGGTHQQDWSTEIGDVLKAVHDPETDELIIDARLPPAGEDPIADKAWTRMTKYGEKLGFSIGGKLRKAYYELRGELGKRVKVLDEIALRHVALTKNPSYTPSFAAAVAKTFTADPGELAFAEVEDTEQTDVAKAGDPQGDASGQNSATGDRNAGTNQGGNEKDASDPDNGDQDNDEDPGSTPKAERHLACPNCGHEFAADLPSEADETTPTQDLDEGKTKDPDRTAKTAQEPPMPDIIERLRELISEEPVAKTDPSEPAAPADGEVAKTETTEQDGDVLKMLAASHRAHEESIAKLREDTNTVLGAVAKAVTGLSERIDSLPRGRRSVARILPDSHGHEQIGKTDEDPPVEKQVEQAESAVDALKALNKATYGIE